MVFQCFLTLLPNQITITESLTNQLKQTAFRSLLNEQFPLIVLGNNPARRQYTWLNFGFNRILSARPFRIFFFLPGAENHLSQKKRFSQICKGSKEFSNPFWIALDIFLNFVAIYEITILVKYDDITNRETANKHTKH